MVWIPVTAVGVYISVSYICFRFPGLLHKFRPPIVPESRRKVWLISHRGGAQENPENTIQAYKHAKSLGTDMLELDVHFTRDKQVVVVHDNHLLRLSHEDILVNETDYSDLPPLAESVKLHFSNKHYDTTGKDRRFPLLKEVFEAFPDTPINLDLKIHSEELIASASELIKEYNREKITVWGSSHSNTSKRCFEVNRNIPQFFPATSALVLYISYVTGLLPFIPIKHQYLEIPFIGPDWKTALHRRHATVSDYAFYMIRFLNVISGPLIAHLNRRGILVFAWVLNDEAEYSDCLKYRFNGIMTDRPTLLKQFLDRKLSGTVSTRQ